MTQRTRARGWRSPVTKDVRHASDRIPEFQGPNEYTIRDGEAMRWFFGDIGIRFVWFRSEVTTDLTVMSAVAAQSLDMSGSTVLWRPH